MFKQHLNLVAVGIAATTSDDFCKLVRHGWTTLYTSKSFKHTLALRMIHFIGFQCKSKFENTPGQTHNMLQRLHIPSGLGTHAFEDMTVGKDVWAIHLQSSVYSKKSWMVEKHLKPPHTQLFVFQI